LSLRPMNPRARAHLALIAANLIYGANFSISKIAMPAFIEPQGFIVLRVAFSLLLFWIFSRSSAKGVVVDFKDHIKLFFLGLSGVAINQMLFFEGLARTSNINAALILTTNPIMVMAGASIVYKEKITLFRALGILFGIAGASALILLQMNGKGTATWQGDLMVLLNAAAYAAFMVFVKPLMKKYSPMLVIRWSFFYGFLFVIPFGTGQVMDIEWSTFTTPIWLSTFYVIIASTFLAYWFNTFGLQHLSPSVVSFYIYLQPIFATIISLLITHEPVTVPQILSCLFIFIGVYLVNRPASR
ncbi:MAG: DMT family transporter, partial [Bacteroidota bacterium]